MDEDKNKMLFFGIMLGLIIIVAAGYFVWSNFISRGTLRLLGPAPFTVEIVLGETIECSTSPCDIKGKSGNIQLIITKEGYDSVVGTFKIGRWKTTDVELNFELIPYLEEVFVIPNEIEKYRYEIDFDEAKNLHKLFDAKDPLKRAIVYFQKKIKNPKIFGGESEALVIDKDASENTAYRVDLASKTRDIIDDYDFSNTENGVWSDNGDYFVFEEEGLNNLVLLDKNNETKNLVLMKDLTRFAWIYNDDLFFVTSQDSSVGEGNGEIFSPPSSGGGVTFGGYDPAVNAYYRVAGFTGINSLPDKFIPAQSGQIVYFSVEGKKYRLILK